MKNPYTLCFEVSQLTRTNSASSGMRNIGARISEKRIWSEIVWAEAHESVWNVPKRPLEFARVVITRCSSAPPDGDNLYSGLKHILDALQKCGIIRSDNHECIGMVAARWEKSAPKHGCTRVYVRECEEYELDKSAWNFGEAT